MWQSSSLPKILSFAIFNKYFAFANAKLLLNAMLIVRLCNKQGGVIQDPIRRENEM